MPTFERIYLHPGMHKTGTSTVQHCLFEHRQALAEELSLHYPGLHENLSAPLFSAFTDDPLAYPLNIQRGRDTAARVADYNRENLAALEAGFAEADTRHALLSGEALSYLTETELQRLGDWLSGFAGDVRVLYTVRNPVAWSVSEAQSQIRGGETYQAMNARPQHERIQRKLQRSIAVFGRDAVDVVVFEQARQHPFGLVGGFLESMGYPPDWAAGREPPRQNESMSLEAAHLVSAINTRFPLIEGGSLGEGRSPGDIRTIAAETEGVPFRLDSKALDRIASEAAGDIEWLRDTFGIELDCSADPVDPVPPEALAFSEEAVDSIARQLLARDQEGRELHQLRAELNHSEARILHQQRTLDARDRQLESRRAAVASLQQSLDAARERSRRQEAQFASVEQRARNLERSRDTAERQVEELQGLVRQLTGGADSADAWQADLQGRPDLSLARVRAMEQSLSWRITRPLRAMKRWLTGAR